MNSTQPAPKTNESVNTKPQVSTPANNVSQQPTTNIPQPIKTDAKVTIEKGINLIPTLSKVEVVQEKKKAKLNVSAIVSLIILVIVAILIVSFNVFSKLRLNAEKGSLEKYENSVTAYSSKIISSNEIYSRILLYKKMDEKSYSPKKVVDYLNSIAIKSGTAVIGNMSFGNDLSFEIEGQAADLEDVAKFWYLLGNDSKIEQVNLNSVGKNDNGARFSFEGKLVLEDFLNSTD